MVATGVTAAVLLTLPGNALAGQWMQISCVNPNGSAASSEGWAPSASNPGPNGNASIDCGPGNPMNEDLAPGPDTVAYSAENLTYSAPSGSTLAGGTLDISGYSGGGGGSGSGSGSGTGVSAVVYSPNGNNIFECISGISTSAEPQNTCADNGLTYTNTSVTLPSDEGGYVQLDLICEGDSASQCNGPTNAAGDVGQMQLNSAQLLLSNSSVPAGSGFTGTILTPDASGPANLLFTATDPNGPGVYQVTADVDGTQVYSATPDTENGECVPAGTDASTGALEFDDAQPCPQTVSVDVPIDTTTLKNGRHHLTVSVTDAAGNTSPVEDTYVTVDNTVKTPLPKRTRGATKVRVQFLAVPSFSGALTRLLKLTHTQLPSGARVTLAVTGPSHPRLKLATATGAAGVTRLLSDLSRLSFHPGDTLTFTVTAPERLTERVRVTFRDHREPTEKLL